MKFIAVALITFMLSGCFYQSVNQFDISKAISFCGDIENVALINAYFGGREVVECYNGTWASVVDIKGERK